MPKSMPASKEEAMEWVVLSPVVICASVWAATMIKSAAGEPTRIGRILRALSGYQVMLGMLSMPLLDYLLEPFLSPWLKTIQWMHWHQNMFNLRHALGATIANAWVVGMGFFIGWFEEE